MSRHAKYGGHRLAGKRALTVRSRSSVAGWKASPPRCIPKVKSNKNIDMQSSKKSKLALCAAVIVLALGFIYGVLFASVNGSGHDSYIYIDHDDTADSVYSKATAELHPAMAWRLRLCGTLMAYGSHVHPGRYLATPSEGAFSLMRKLRGGRQEPVRLVVPVVHTVQDLAGKMGRVLEADSARWCAAFADASLQRELQVDSCSLPCLFIPDTYEFYWDVEPAVLLRRMKKEHDAFWNAERTAQAKAAGLTPDEAYTLASIVEQESANEAERPMIAGMYLNRLHSGMKLQADPTVKFALRDFGLRRIMHKHLTTDSPYNTYLHEGLPAGPICIPSLSSINAVLHYAHHDFMYMCAKEDFSGTHNFAVTYADHMANARRYADALNKRGISSEE